jgi:hypothetical protein
MGNYGSDGYEQKWNQERKPELHRQSPTIDSGTSGLSLSRHVNLSGQLSSHA